MAAKRGLGKGLDSLIAPKTLSQKSGNTEQGTLPAGNTAADGIIYVPVSEVEPNRAQPRKHFEEEALRELADSIAQHGVLQPLLVRRQDGYYEIIAGERRWRAAKLAKQKTVPVLVKDVTDRERSEISLIENLQREDLDPIEEAAAYRQLIDEYGLKQEEVAKRVSKSRSAITNSMRLLKLDARVQEMLIRQEISAGHARTLLSVANSDRQYEMAQQIAEKNLNVRDAEKLVQKEKGKKKESGGEKRPDRENEQKEAVYREIADRIREKLGTKVEILDDNGAGRIEISYYSPEELDRILELLNI